MTSTEERFRNEIGRLDKRIDDLSLTKLRETNRILRRELDYILHSPHAGIFVDVGGDVTITDQSTFFIMTNSTVLIDGAENFDMPQDGRMRYIGTDNREGGRVGGREMITILGAKPRAEAAGELLVQIVGGQPGAWNLNERIEGFKEAVKGTNIKLCDVLYNEENPDTALQVAENAINARPNLRGFFCSNAFGGPGSALAIKGAVKRGKVKPGRIRVVAFDTTEDILNYIDEGVIDCTLAQQTRNMGRFSIEKLLEYAEQFKKQGKFVSPPEGKDVIDTGVSVVRREDVGKYRTKPAGK